MKCQLCLLSVTYKTIKTENLNFELCSIKCKVTTEISYNPKSPPQRHAQTNNLGHEQEGRMLPTPREFRRHILSERTTQAASNKRRLQPVSGDISL